MALLDWDLLVLTNDGLLRLSMILFFLFVVVEALGAYISNSLSLMGDSLAMSVDVFAYCGNLCAENLKLEQTSRISKKMRFLINVALPGFSLSCLLIVTTLITMDAIKLILNPPLTNIVNVDFMYGFALINLIIDLSIGLLFLIRGPSVFIETAETFPRYLDFDISTDVANVEEFGHLDEFDDDNDKGQVDVEEITRNATFCQRVIIAIYPYAQSKEINSRNAKRNLNMISAGMHVTGDTIRTLSVIVAAIVSTITGIDTDICDAWAAVVVAITILVLALPLIRDVLILTVAAIRDVNNEDENRGDYFPVKLDESSPILPPSDKPRES